MSEKRGEKEKKTKQGKLEFYVYAMDDTKKTKYENLDDAVKAYIAYDKGLKRLSFSLRGMDLEVVTLKSFTDGLNHCMMPEDVSRFFRSSIDATPQEIENILKNLERLREPMIRDNKEIIKKLQQEIYEFKIKEIFSGRRIYQRINETDAMTAHSMKYYYPYVVGTRTNEYMEKVDEAYSIADKIKKVKPEAAEYAYKLVYDYSIALAKNINQSIKIDCMCPSDMIAGAKNISAKKKEQQNVERKKNKEEYKKIEKIKEKLNDILTGKENVHSIKSNNRKKSTKKMEEVENLQQIVKESEVFVQKATMEKNREIDSMTPEEKEDHVQAVDLAIDYGQQEYISEEDMELYKQIIEERSKVSEIEENQVSEFDGKENKRILSEKENKILDAPTDIDLSYDKLQEKYDMDEISYEEFKKRTTILDINNQIGIYGLEKDEALFSNLSIERQSEISQEVQKGLRTLVNMDEINNGRISYDTIKAIATQGYIYQDEKFEKASHVKTENKFFKKIENSEKMKLQLVFDGKPNEEIRDILKENYFNWSSKEKAWQRLLTGNARYAADTVLSQFEKLDEQGKFKIEKVDKIEEYKKNLSHNRYKKFHGKEFEKSEYDYSDLQKQVLSAQNRKIKKLLQNNSESKLESNQNILQQERLGMIEDVDLEIEIEA